VGPRVGLNAVSKRKIPSPRRESNPDHPVTIPTELSRIIERSESVFAQFHKISSLSRTEGHKPKIRNYSLCETDIVAISKNLIVEGCER
jgi:hypothetical protein